MLKKTLLSISVMTVVGAVGVKLERRRRSHSAFHAFRYHGRLQAQELVPELVVDHSWAAARRTIQKHFSPSSEFPPQPYVVKGIEVLAACGLAIADSVDTLLTPSEFHRE